MVDRIWDDGRMKIGGDSENFLSVRCYYSRGGNNGWRSDPRGYYLSVTPVRRVARNGYAVLECCPSDGIKILVDTVNRRSAKRDEEASNAAKLLLGDLVDRVCAKNGIDRGDVGDLLID